MLEKSQAFFQEEHVVTMMMDEKMSLQKHLMKLKDMCDQLEEEDIVVITLKSLPRVYKIYIEMFNITSANVDLKFDELCIELFQQARWRQQFGSHSDIVSMEHVFTTKDKGKGEHTQQKGHHVFEEGYQKNITRYYCEKLGHTQRFCRNWLAYKKSNEAES